MGIAMVALVAFAFVAAFAVDFYRKRHPDAGHYGIDY